MSHNFADLEIRNAQAEEKLRTIGRLMKDTMPPGWGFAFFVFTYEPGSFFYTSSAGDREDMIKLLEEFLVKLKGN